MEKENSVMYKEKILQNLNEIVSHDQAFDESTEEGELNRITTRLKALGDYVREEIQAETSQQIKDIIEKLKADSEIDDTDLKLIRLWVVGDAAAYVRMENDYKKWLEESNRLFSVIRGLKAEELNLEKMHKLSGTVRDSIRVIGDLIFFRQQMDRVKKFEAASKNLNSQNKLLLSRILQEKLASADT
jgi:predicted O-linked N-acetylglucosamine transferase (SPINDLY family)